MMVECRDRDFDLASVEDVIGSRGKDLKRRSVACFQQNASGSRIVFHDCPKVLGEESNRHIRLSLDQDRWCILDDGYTVHRGNLVVKRESVGIRLLGKHDGFPGLIIRRLRSNCLSKCICRDK